jgi:hypothetical protein
VEARTSFVAEGVAWSSTVQIAKAVAGEMLAFRAREDLLVDGMPVVA